MKCYLCDKEATSKEHCPAKSFFPVNKCTSLIKVPSCSIHNEDTSLDDEYVRNLILMTKGNNEIAEMHLRNKGLKSLLRKAGLFNLMTKNPQRLNFIKDDEDSKNLAFEIDRDRFDKGLRKIAYGIYYFAFSQIWYRNLVVSTHNLVTEKLKVDSTAELIQYLKKESDFEIIYEGANPEVFKYSFLHQSSTNNKILVMQFYEWFEVWIIPKQNSFQPSLDS